MLQDRSRALSVIRLDSDLRWLASVAHRRLLGHSG